MLMGDRVGRVPRDRAVRRRGRDRERVRDDHRRPHPDHRAAAAARVERSRPARCDRARGAPRRHRRLGARCAGRDPASPPGCSAIGVAGGALPAAPFRFAEPVILLPVAAVVLTTWLASWVGSRRVLVVSPMEAIGAAHERNAEDVARRPARNRFAIVLFSIGTALLVFGVLVGLVTPARRVHRSARRHPVVHRRRARCGDDHAGRAAAHRPRARTRSDRAARGRERGAVPGAQHPHHDRRRHRGRARDHVRRRARDLRRPRPRSRRANDRRSSRASRPCSSITNLVISVLVGFSALIAAVGLVNTLSLGVAAAQP